MKTFILTHMQARERCAAYAMSAPDGCMARFSEPKRNSDQSAKFHAQIDDIAAQYEIFGRKWNSEDMKRLLIDQFWRDTKDDEDLRALWDRVQPRMAPSLDGSGVVQLGAQSRMFPKRLASAFIDWLAAFGDENNIVWSDK